MLIAEDLLLLVTDDHTGKLVAPGAQVDVALGGAMLVELTLAHRVDVAEESDSVRPGRLVVRDSSAVADTLLDAARARVSPEQGKKPKDVVPALGKGVRGQLHTRLVDRGLLREESGKILGIFPTHHWPVNDAAHENEVRGLLAQAARAERPTPPARPRSSPYFTPSTW